MASADLDNVLSNPVFDSADEVSESLSDLDADTFKSSGFSGSLLASTASDLPSNLEKKPFNFPEPIIAINEECEEMDGIYSDKCICLWEIEKLPNFS